MKITDERETKRKNRNKQTNKDRKQQGVTEAIVKVLLLDNFVVHLR